jgi:hypothetical protein
MSSNDAKWYRRLADLALAEARAAEPRKRSGALARYVAARRRSFNSELLSKELSMNSFYNRRRGQAQPGYDPRADAAARAVLDDARAEEIARELMGGRDTRAAGAALSVQDADDARAEEIAERLLRTPAGRAAGGRGGAAFATALAHAAPADIRLAADARARDEGPVTPERAEAVADELNGKGKPTYREEQEIRKQLARAAALIEGSLGNPPVWCALSRAVENVQRALDIQHRKPTPREMDELRRSTALAEKQGDVVLPPPLPL